MKTYLTHYRNRCLLDRLLISLRGDFKGTYEVEQEVKICDRKLDYWRGHSLFLLDRETMTKMSQIKSACLAINF